MNMLFVNYVRVRRVMCHVTRFIQSQHKPTFTNKEVGKVSAQNYRLYTTLFTLSLLRENSGKGALQPQQTNAAPTTPQPSLRQHHQRLVELSQNRLGRRWRTSNPLLRKMPRPQHSVMGLANVSLTVQRPHQQSRNLRLSFTRKHS